MTLTDSELRDAIEMCGKATKGPMEIGSIAEPENANERYCIRPVGTGYLIATVEDSIFYDSKQEERAATASAIAFYLTHGESLLRELEARRARCEELERLGREMNMPEDSTRQREHATDLGPVVTDDEDDADSSIECCDGTVCIERQGPRGKAETTSNDGRERAD